MVTLFFSNNSNDQPADYKGLLSIDPDSDNVSILVVIVVAGCAYTSPDESHI